MIESGRALIEALSDGEFHSGVELGDALGLSRSAISKQVAQLGLLGLDVMSVKGRGYALTRALQLLDAKLIRQALMSDFKDDIDSLDVFQTVTSTNRFLSEKATRGEGMNVCLAEFQTDGHGRRGRQWLSPFGAGICLSVSRQFSGGLASLQGLSLAVGVALVRQLEALEIRGLSLKWPNDILFDGRKLAGILIEVSGEESGDGYAVVGFGLNLQLTDGFDEAVGQSVAHLSQTGWLGERNRLAASLIDGLIDCLPVFSRVGFAAYRQSWLERAAYLNQSVVMTVGASSAEGVMKGVGDYGELLVQVDGKCISYTGGEISLRKL